MTPWLMSAHLDVWAVSTGTRPAPNPTVDPGDGDGSEGRTYKRPPASSSPGAQRESPSRSSREPDGEGRREPANVRVARCDDHPALARGRCRPTLGRHFDRQLALPLLAIVEPPVLLQLVPQRRRTCVEVGVGRDTVERPHTRPPAKAPPGPSPCRRSRSTAASRGRLAHPADRARCDPIRCQTVVGCDRDRIGQRGDCRIRVQRHRKCKHAHATHHAGG